MLFKVEECYFSQTQNLVNTYLVMDSTFDANKFTSVSLERNTRFLLSRNAKSLDF